MAGSRESQAGLEEGGRRLCRRLPLRWRCHWATVTVWSLPRMSGVRGSGAPVSPLSGSTSQGLGALAVTCF